MLNIPTYPHTYIHPKFTWRMIIEFRDEAFGFPLVTQLYNSLNLYSISRLCCEMTTPGCLGVTSDLQHQGATQ